MNLVSNPFFSLTKEVVEDCLVKEELDRLRSEDEDRGSGERHYHLLTEFHQEQKDIVQAMNVIELLESVSGAKLTDRGAGNGIVKPSSRVKEGIERIRSRMLRIDFQFCLIHLEEKIKRKKEE